MSIYRTDEGEHLVREWCEHRVERGPWEVTRSVETSLGRTHLAMVGQGSPLVLWLPGTNFNSATTWRLAGLVGQHLRFCVVDLPGQPGLSSPMRLGRDRLSRYGRWLNELVESLAGDPIIIAGHSLGAAVALSASPAASIRALALFNPAGLNRAKITPKLLAVTLRWITRPSATSAQGLIRYMQHPSASIDPELVDWLALVARHTRQDGAPGPLSDEKLAQWRNQATVVAGDADPFFPPERLADDSTKALGTTLEAIPEAGHLLPEETPNRVLDVLLDLADRVAR